ncbi:ferrochelatase [Schaalia sp. lx-100]|uniref:ferrochelatase n=1 Tax=Schaalia sp. lx-100 TaxID=2899081 RepID=UPI001E60AEBF|nr:ferrochelatase [Schaalia sp. lx-100]MCD4557677.1 ferrochelatase [Schaalia sp. lx-100]
MTNVSTVSENSQTPAISETSMQTRPTLLLINLGTPEAPTPSAIRTFLREFLSDPRVVEMRPLLWKMILETFILPFRPRMIAPQYRSIWTEGGSPLMRGTQEQAEQLQRIFGEQLNIRIAMRYGNSSIKDELTRIYNSGCRKVLILSAYPQYAASTVGTVYDEVARWALSARDQMEIRTIRSFQGASEYIEALAQAIEAHWQEHGRPHFDAGDRLILSFHSIPVAMRDLGDPYPSECEETYDLLAERLRLPREAIMRTYQSVFGRAEWVGPATIDTVKELGRTYKGRLDVICPGFMADCLETLEEINELNRQAFYEAGGTEFHYIPWGNGSKGAVATLAEQIRQGAAGWLNNK